MQTVIKRFHNSKLVCVYYASQVIIITSCDEEVRLQKATGIRKSLNIRKGNIMAKRERKGVSLFTAQRASAADQLSLALIWNRADIARTEIFTEDQKWEVTECKS